MAQKERSTYTSEFKLQLVQLYLNGKRKVDITKEYGVGRTALDNWIRQYSNSGSFKAKDNRTEEEEELILLRKENKRLLMENDILKQAALIIGRK